MDDKPDNLVSLEALLDDGGRNFLHAHSGEAALSLLLDHDVALTLLDVQMPGMDGYETARLMRGNPRTRHIPILFLTAVFQDEASMLRGYESGAIDYLQKPVNTAVLLSKVNVFLELDRARRQLSRFNRQLDDARAYYAAILDTAGEGILVATPEGRINYANPSACRMLCVTEAELYGIPLVQLTVPPNANVIPWENSVFFHNWRNQRTFRTHDGMLYAPDGRSLPVNLSSSPLPSPHQGLVVVFQDVSEPKRLQEQLRHQLVTDALTGLSNRQGFMQALNNALSRAARLHKSLAVLYLDLDGFKRINDTLGHQAGDLLLRGVAERLHNGVRAYDVLGRQGGDEFTVLLDSLDSAEDAVHIAEKLLEDLNLPHELDGIQISVGASIGIATYPECSDDAERLVRAADVAMYQAKTEGRNQYRFFTEEMNGRAKARLLLEESLRQAVAFSEFQLYYQPQLRLGDGQIRGFEALLRWHHRTAGLVAPSVFVPLLEETGLINQIGTWIIEQACRQRAEWASVLAPDVSVAVNLSPRQFANHQLIDDIAMLIDRYKLRPHQIEIEVTEGSLMQDMEYSRRFLRELRTMGLRLSVDDFGTGYSSLAYLKQFELDALKIDRLFVANLLQSERDAAIAHSIIQLGHNLDLEVVAEGVETLPQLERLREMGCDVAQGFYFAKPLPSENVSLEPAKLTPTVVSGGATSQTG